MVDRIFKLENYNEVKRMLKEQRKFNMKKGLINIYRFAMKMFGYPYLYPRNIWFVAGCPRSGTTAIFDWLCKSSQSVGFDEQKISKAASNFLHYVYQFKVLYEDKDILAQLLKSLIYKYCSYKRFIWNKNIVLKEPLSPGGDEVSVDFIENLRKIFPNIKIIFLMRHPVSVFNSMHKRKWGYSVRNCLPVDMPLDKGIEIWKSNAHICMKNTGKDLYVCKYEDLINNPEAESIKIREFLKIKKLDIFKVKDSKKIDLEEHIIQKILNDTISERKVFGY